MASFYVREVALGGTYMECGTTVGTKIQLNRQFECYGNKSEYKREKITALHSAKLVILQG